MIIDTIQSVSYSRNGHRYSKDTEKALIIILNHYVKQKYSVRCNLESLTQSKIHIVFRDRVHKLLPFSNEVMNNASFVSHRSQRPSLDIL